MKAGLVLLMIISAVLMFATTVYADEGATTHNATYVMKDAKGNAVGLATFTRGRQWLGPHQRQRERHDAGPARHPHPQ